jgi:uncharacterized protein YodC (DUF2158 family)
MIGDIMKTTQEFVTGDKVQLKSGGPIMTVDAKMNSGFHTGKYHCQWFNGATLKEGIFAFDSLKRADVIVNLDI